MKKKKIVKDLYQEITDKIILLLESHLDSWNKSWVKYDHEGKLSYNAYSKTFYSGFNQILLSYTSSENDYPKNGWLTFKQISDLGGKVIKGQKSSSIYFWKFLYYQNNKLLSNPEKYAKYSKQILAELGITICPILRYFNVFNIFQTEGLSDDYYFIEPNDTLVEFEKDLIAEDLIKNTRAVIQHKAQDKACYIPKLDKIILPKREQFDSSEAYYLTTFHELSHWTGHESRLNRVFNTEFGSSEYAFEELIAELSSAFLTTELNINTSITNNAAYIDNWLFALRNDKSFILKASSKAQKAATFIKSFTPEYVI